MLTDEDGNPAMVSIDAAMQRMDDWLGLIMRRRDGQQMGHVALWLICRPLAPEEIEGSTTKERRRT